MKLTEQSLLAARQLETAARRFLTSCAAAQLRGNIGHRTPPTYHRFTTAGRVDQNPNGNGTTGNSYGAYGILKEFV